MSIGYFDAHCDTLIAYRSLYRSKKTHLDLQRLSAFSPSAQVFALWADPEKDGLPVFRKLRLQLPRISTGFPERLLLS